ncbi:MAG: DUF3880 domain-containing protein [bacterium]|nr:DUF3880 domain-containing protein [bacterium]
MRFLFPYTENSVFDIAFALRDMGHTVDVFDKKPLIVNTVESQPYCQEIKRALQTSIYDYVITYLYIPELSTVCEECGVDYIAWVYDSPLLSLHHASIYHSHNRLFLFDQAQANRLRAIGVEHIYHLPLAAMVSRADNLCFEETDAEAYGHEIAFVGQLYSQNMYNDCIHMLPETIATPCKHYLLHELCNWHQMRPWPVFPKAGIDAIHSLDFHNKDLQTFEFPEEYYWGIMLLSRKLAEMERMTALSTLAESHPVDLYAPIGTCVPDAIRLHPPLNYYTQAGKVFRHSKINLNLTLPSIESGVPQRVFDILSFGGFLMTNAQPEIEDFFTPGRDLVVFHDLDELKSLTDYYLSHPKEREAIAQNGYETVKENYSYEKVLAQVIYLCEQEKEH